MIEKSLTQIARDIRQKNTTSAQVVSQTIARINEVQSLNALNYVDADGARTAAESIDRRIAAGKPVGRLAGVPVIIKDNICVKGMTATCSSKMLANFVPPYHATVVEKLLAEDAILIAKANMDEFAMGSSNETSYFGPVRNPHATQYVPGGSSGGSAAAVASMQGFAALGSDTGGSIRQPASLCGVVGLKPTYGTVSRYGVVAFASSLDQVGPLTRTVEDCALVMDVIAGHDGRESTSRDIKKLDYLSLLAKDGLKGKTIGFPTQFFEKLENVDVKNAMQQVVSDLQELGARILPLSMPTLEYAIAAYYIIASAEAASNLARYDGVKYGHRAEKFTDVVDLYYKTRTEGFGSEVKRRIMLGNFVLSSGYFDAYYIKALKCQTLIKNQFAEAFARCDFIMTPTSPTPAFRIGDKSGDPIAMYLSDIYTVPVNIAGNCAISLPCGVSKDNLPIGLQLIANHLQEPALLSAANTYERCVHAKH